MGFDLKKKKDEDGTKSSKFNLSKNDGNLAAPAVSDVPKKSGVKYFLMGGLILAALIVYLMMNNGNNEKEVAQNNADGQNTSSPVEPSKSSTPEVGDNPTPTNNPPAATSTTGGTDNQNSQNTGKENVSTKTTEPIKNAELNKVKIVEDFPKNSAFMNFNQSEMASLISTLKANPNIKLTITGHTDSDGDESHNMQLSIQRARTLYNYLVENGISGKRLTIKGLGESNPIADNSTESGKAKNRRVEYTMH